MTVLLLVGQRDDRLITSRSVQLLVGQRDDCLITSRTKR